MASKTNIKAHQATYDAFIGMVKVSTPVILLIAALVIFLITRHH
jgi:hypothetical protein